MNWHSISDKMLIDVLSSRGYVVRHKSEARRPLSWNRTAPFPEGVDFKLEAVEKLRAQIDANMIDFHVDRGSEFVPEIHRAVLRVI